MVMPCEAITAQMGLLFSCAPVGQYVRIQTPFLYPDGDVIDIFYRETGDTITLTDLGETLRWLNMQTVSLQKSRKQNQLIADICLNHNVEIFHGMFTTRVQASEDLSRAVMRLSQALLRASDLWFTYRTKLGESVVDDVEELLQDRSIPFDRKPRIPGRSGSIWRPDFQTRQEKQSAFIRVLSTGSRAATRDMLFQTTAMWLDLSYLSVGQEKTRFISLFDDTVDIWAIEDFRLVENISEVAYWSRSDEFLEKIA